MVTFTHLTHDEITGLPARSRSEGTGTGIHGPHQHLFIKVLPVKWHCTGSHDRNSSRSINGGLQSFDDFHTQIPDNPGQTSCHISEVSVLHPAPVSPFDVHPHSGPACSREKIA
jgi:hypothetical protein